MHDVGQPNLPSTESSQRIGGISSTRWGREFFRGGVRGAGGGVGSLGVWGAGCC